MNCVSILVFCGLSWLCAESVDGAHYLRIECEVDSEQTIQNSLTLELESIYELRNSIKSPLVVS